MDKKTIINSTRISLAVALLALSLIGGSAYAMGGGWHGDGHRGGKHHGEEMMMKNVDRKVENIDKGVVITMTSEDTDIVSKLQAHQMPAPKGGSVNVLQVNVTGGVKITITSDDPNEVKKIQDREIHPRGFGPGMGLDFSKVQKKVENTTNGATITLTSDDADTIKKIQDFVQHFGDKRPFEQKIDDEQPNQ